MHSTQIGGGALVMTTDRDRLSALISKIFEDHLAEQEFAELSRLLLSDAAAREEYQAMLRIHTALRFELNNSLNQELLQACLDVDQAKDHLACSPSAPTTNRSLLLGFLDKLPTAIQPAQHPARFYSLAAFLTLAIWAVLALVVWPLGERGDFPRETLLAVDFHALVLQANNVAWAQGQRPLNAGTRLAMKERISLERGSLQILFGDGARVVLEGPAVVLIDGRNAMALDEGRILARVEDQAKGFLVATPTVRVIDLGTEFGVDVRNQETEVHVFEGRVEVLRVDAPGDQSQRLSANEAAKFGNSPQLGFYAQEKEMNRATYLALAALLATPVTELAHGLPLDIETVLVGNPGNLPDAFGFGAVAYDYRIGKYEVTNAQYTVFLNAVAGIDTHNLYSSAMSSSNRSGITRSGSGTFGDPYVYAKKHNFENQPVNNVSFWDAARFVNWLNNGQPSGAQEIGTTESGAYSLNGVTNPTNLSISRVSDAVFFLPSLDEWYKAAFYDPELNSGAGGYHTYATRNSALPTLAQVNPQGEVTNPGSNVVNFSNGAVWNSMSGNVTTVGGAGSTSFYGTFDQSGNVQEWNEAIVGNSTRRHHGGGWSSNSGQIAVPSNNNSTPITELETVGFRIAALYFEPPMPPVGGEIPEPASGAVVGLCGLFLLGLKQSRRRRRDRPNPSRSNNPECEPRNA